MVVWASLIVGGVVRSGLDLGYILKIKPAALVMGGIQIIKERGQSRMPLRFIGRASNGSSLNWGRGI